MSVIILTRICKTPKPPEYINHKFIIGQGSTSNAIYVPKGIATPPKFVTRTDQETKGGI